MQDTLPFHIDEKRELKNPSKVKVDLTQNKTKEGTKTYSFIYAFRQQTLKAWRPKITLSCVIIMNLLVGKYFRFLNTGCLSRYSKEGIYYGNLLRCDINNIILQMFRNLPTILHIISGLLILGRYCEIPN